MSLECSQCERDLRGGHDIECPNYRPDALIELQTLARFIRSGPPEINPDDARDDIARVIENRIDALKRRFDLE